MTRETIEILVPDRELEQHALIAIGSRRRFAVSRWERPWGASAPVAASVGFARAEHLASLPPLDPARWSRWGGCVVFVKPGTPVEVLSCATRVASDRRSVLQFVTLHRPDELMLEVRRFVERLYQGLESERVLHAWWSGASLHLLTTRFERLSISHRSLPELRGVSYARCEDVEVDHDGGAILLPRAERWFEAAVLLERARRRRGGRPAGRRRIRGCPA